MATQRGKNLHHNKKSTSFAVSAEVIISNDV
jgi:hypothetical protein